MKRVQAPPPCGGSCLDAGRARHCCLRKSGVLVWLCPTAKGGFRQPSNLSFPKTHGFLFFFLAFAHRAFAALLARSFLSCALRAAMRAITPFPLAALPPFLPISRITSEIRPRLITSFYNGKSSLANS